MATTAENLTDEELQVILDFRKRKQEGENEVMQEVEAGDSSLSEKKVEDLAATGDKQQSVLSGGDNDDEYHVPGGETQWAAYDRQIALEEPSRNFVKTDMLRCFKEWAHSRNHADEGILYASIVSTASSNLVSDKVPKEDRAWHQVTLEQFSMNMDRIHNKYRTYIYAAEPTLGFNLKMRKEIMTEALKGYRKSINPKGADQKKKTAENQAKRRAKERAKKRQHPIEGLRDMKKEGKTAGEVKKRKCSTRYYSAE